MKKFILFVFIVSAVLPLPAKKFWPSAWAFIESLADKVILNIVEDCSYEQAQLALEYALLVEAHCSEEPVEKAPGGYEVFIPENIESSFEYFFMDADDEDEADDLFTMHRLGILARIYKKDNKLVVVFRGTEPNWEENPVRFATNWATNFVQGLSKECSIVYEYALVVARALIDAYPEYEIVFTGISKGGGLAQYVGAMTGKQAVCFNSPQLGKCSNKNINERYGDISVELPILHVHVAGELLNFPINLNLGGKVGQSCQILAHDYEIDPLSLHFTENLVPSICAYLNLFGKNQYICPPY